VHIKGVGFKGGMGFQLVRIPGCTYAYVKDLIKTRPDGVVLLDVPRLPTAAASFARFARVIADPGNDEMIVRMGSVGLRIEGRTSAYDLFRMPFPVEGDQGALFAIDTKDDDFVAAIYFDRP
jgi:hypothetical protein